MRTANAFNKILPLASMIMLCLCLMSCGGGDTPTAETEANFQGQGFSLKVEQTTLNTYKFTVIENTSHKNAVFSVYGLPDDSAGTTFNTNAHMRLAHVFDGAQPGHSFEVTFHDDDSWFAIYQDDWDGFSWIYSTRVEMIRGNFRQ